MKLSVEQSRKFFDKIIFYGDHEAISQICNIIEFDEVYDDIEQLNTKNIPDYFYSLPKAVVCEKMKEPFVLLENDFYLWDIPKESNFLNSELIIEDAFETPSEFLLEIERMKQNELTVRPRWYKFAKNKELQIPLKGIYGGTNIKFINDHAQEVIRLVENKENLKHFQTDDARKKYINTHKIYDCWYLGVKIDAQNINCFTLRIVT